MPIKQKLHPLEHYNNIVDIIKNNTVLKKKELNKDFSANKIIESLSALMEDSFNNFEPLQLDLTNISIVNTRFSAKTIGNVPLSIFISVFHSEIAVTLQNSENKDRIQLEFEEGKLKESRKEIIYRKENYAGYKKVNKDINAKTILETLKL